MHRRHNDDTPDSPGDRDRAEQVAEGDALPLDERARLQAQEGIETTEFEGTIEG